MPETDRWQTVVAMKIEDVGIGGGWEYRICRLFCFENKTKNLIDNTKALMQFTYLLIKQNRGKNSFHRGIFMSFGNGGVILFFYSINESEIQI